MLKNNYIIKNIKIVVLVFAIGFVSCNDAIDIGPEDEITESNAITSIEDVESALIGTYASIPGTTAIYWNSLFTDEVRKTNDNNGQGIQTHTWSINSGNSEASALYSTYFGLINVANRVLVAIDNIPAANAEEAELMGRYKGELLAIRGWAHFKVLTYFTSSFTDNSVLAVPYIDYVVVLDKPARNTLGEVYAGIENDLTSARNLIPDDFTDNFFFTKNAVLALESRIALFRKDYSTAITKSSQLISQYPLSPISGYPSIWNDTNDTEIIFKIARVQGDGAVGQLYSPSDALIYFVGSDKILDSYDANDIRFLAFFNDGTDANRIMKYPGNASAFGLNHLKEFRISEQYLIRAEAYANSSQLGLAADDINMLRTNRISGVTAESFSGPANANAYILEERFRELAYEGHRFLDLKRQGLGIDRNASDCDQLDATACSLPSGNYRFALPIPQAEIFTNPNIIPNPGYN